VPMIDCSRFSHPPVLGEGANLPSTVASRWGAFGIANTVAVLSTRGAKRATN
jgi:hypothetical protein